MLIQTKIIDSNFRFHISYVARSSKGMFFQSKPGLCIVDSGLSCDTFNIIHIDNISVLNHTDLKEAIGHFAEKKSDFCLWVNEDNLDKDLELFLFSNGFNKSDGEQGMLLPVKNYQSINIPNKDKMVHGRQADIIFSYAAVVANNWNPPDVNVLKFYSENAEAIVNSKHHIWFAVSHVDEQAVSCLEICSENNITAGIYGFATLENYRGLGLGTTLMHFAIQQCIKLGYQQIVLQSSKAGLGIYQKMGFQTITQYYEFTRPS